MSTYLVRLEQVGEDGLVGQHHAHDVAVRHGQHLLTAQANGDQTAVLCGKTWNHANDWRRQGKRPDSRVLSLMLSALAATAFACFAKMSSPDCGRVWHHGKGVNFATISLIGDPCDKPCGACGRPHECRGARGARYAGTWGPCPSLRGSAARAPS